MRLLIMMNKADFLQAAPRIYIPLQRLTRPNVEICKPCTLNVARIPCPIRPPLVPSAPNRIQSQCAISWLSTRGQLSVSSLWGLTCELRRSIRNFEVNKKNQRKRRIKNGGRKKSYGVQKRKNVLVVDCVVTGTRLKCSSGVPPSILQ